MKKTNQKGFSIAEALLILVVIGILGFTGWFVYHAKQTSDKNYSAASQTVPTYKKKTDAISTANKYVGWKSYSSSNGLGLSFKYPASWTISENDPTQMCAGQVTATATPSAMIGQPSIKSVPAIQHLQSEVVLR